MLQNTRALRRASAAAEARSAVTARRPMLILGTVLGAVLGVTLTVGVISAPAAGAEDITDPVEAVAQMVSGAESPARIADEAAVPLMEAADAVTAAESLNADVAASGLDVQADELAVDTSGIEQNIRRLADRAALSTMLVTVLTVDTVEKTAQVIEGTAVLQQALTAAQEKKAADDAARAAAEQAAAAAAALAAANTVDGAKATAQQMASGEYGWGGDQFSCLESLWTKESGWNYQAYNPSGATGIPQALPGSKMASAGSDWESNAATQIAWGLGYIADVYGTPCSAWSHSQAVNWY
ncbi:phospholipase [Microbacterium sp. SD291]|uniref:aggregation-promoting factor C-terminal-like domain-containing protein n=1 Tax=Microbacterium sp. SD291 TaxID=2782007 RepID=UPI001A96866C|nr:phospholipase [Microbacterium sp. SD291]MBO0979324.1 phospholipase [Microbacterium sp. SD291]